MGLCTMLREEFPTRGGTCHWVRACPLGRMLLEGMGLGVAILLRPFDPGDRSGATRDGTPEREKRGEASANRLQDNEEKLLKDRLKGTSGIKIACLAILSCMFVNLTFALEPRGGSAASPSRYGAGRCLARWPSCVSGRP